MIARLKSLFGIEAKALAAPSHELLALFGAAPTASGHAVTPERALRVPAVYACVKVIAEAVAQLPLHLYRRAADGRKERATDHPLHALLNDAPNDWTSAPEFRQFMQTQVLLHGDAFAFVNRDAAGRVAELIPLPSTAVAVETDALTGEPSYRVTSADGSSRVYDRAAIFHLRTIGTDPNKGLSPIVQAREAIGLAMAMEEHAARLFGQGARPSGVFEYAKQLGPDAIRRLRESFNAAHAGGANSGKTLILEDGMTFRPVQFSSVDLQFLEMRRHQIAEIARVFRVPLHMLQELERTTHNNAEHMGAQFLALTLLPWLKLWEAAIRRSLLTAEERADHYAEFLTDDLARADLAARMTAYATAIMHGVLSPNEARAAENRAPYDGGDRFRLPLNSENVGGADGTA